MDGIALAFSPGAVMMAGPQPGHPQHPAKTGGRKRQER